MNNKTASVKYKRTDRISIEISRRHRKFYIICPFFLYSAGDTPNTRLA